jgi:MFS family permease
MLFMLDSMARASLSTVIPLQAYHVLGNARDVSLLFTSVGWVGVAATLFIPTLVRRFRPRGVYTMAVVMLILAPLLMALGSFTGLVSGLMLRTLAGACLLNVLNLYIMAYIKKRDLSRSEPLRTFFSAFAWCIGPSLGPFLFENVSPYAAFGLSSACAVLLLIYFWWLRLEYGPALAPGEEVRTNPFPHIRRYFAQPRLTLAWLLNFGRETWWVTFFVYTPIYMAQAGPGGEVGGYIVSGGTGMLFASHFFGWLARRHGLRTHLIAANLICALGTAAAILVFDAPWQVAAALLVAAFGAVSMDAIALVPFLRAVRARERPEMTMVFSLFRESAGLVPLALFSVLLSFFDLRSVWLAVALGLLGCAWLARFIPRGM